MSKRKSEMSFERIRRLRSDDPFDPIDLDPPKWQSEILKTMQSGRKESDTLLALAKIIHSALTSRGVRVCENHEYLATISEESELDE